MVSLLDWLRVVLITALLIPLVYLSTRFLGKRYAGGMRGRNFEILEALPVDQYNKLLLARLVDRLFVLSASPHGLEVIYEITDPEQLKELKQQARKPESHGSWLPFRSGRE
ncbi:MAG: flagellar biosynthetic protein FliO [Firmicutes bacterium]|nr:flagellar biosynthetic protein FliO [Bacillota bacterium]